jgi:hypothetical protein
MSQGLGAAFDRAQAAYDAREPEDDHDCEHDGHRWRRTRIAVIKGDTIVEYKCRECGARKAD